MNDFSLARVLTGAVNFAFGLAAIGLVLRLFLRLFGADPEGGFTSFIYASTSPLLDPFRGIFQPYVIEPGNVLEFSTIIAIVIYLIIAFLINALILFVAERR